MLDGLKSYISGAVIVLFAGLYVFDIIDVEVFLKIFGIFAGLGVVSLRGAISKISPVKKNKR